MTKKSGRRKTGKDFMQKSLHAVSNTLCLWSLCPRAKCTRARTCKGDARICLPRLSPYTPLQAREYVIDLLNAREFGFTPEQAVRNHLAQSGALADWLRARQ